MSGCNWFNSKPSHKTDETLITNFQKNKEDLTRLVQISKEKNWKYSYVSTEDLNENRISDEKTKEYELLWRKFLPERPFPFPIAGNSMCFELSHYLESRFYIFSIFDKNEKHNGNISYSSLKGYCWFDNNPPKEQIVNNLDVFDATSYENLKTGEKISSFRNVEGNWYLYYQAYRYLDEYNDHD